MEGDFQQREGARPSKEEIELENIDAVRRGASSNLRRHILNLATTEIPVVVSINKFSSDTVARDKCYKRRGPKNSEQ